MVDIHDLDSMALCAWREARGEGEDGMRAVLHVIRNRAHEWYRHYIHPVHVAVYAKNQFTSMSVVGDPQFRLMPLPGDRQYAFCLAMATKVMSEANPDLDLTHGALYYANLEDANSGWFYQHIVKSEAHRLVAVIGRHHFYI